MHFLQKAEDSQLDRQTDRQTDSQLDRQTDSDYTIVAALKTWSHMEAIEKHLTHRQTQTDKASETMRIEQDIHQKVDTFPPPFMSHK